MLKYASLLGVAHAASTVSNVVCNGLNEIRFDVDVPSGSNGPSLFKFQGCDSGNNVDKTTQVSVNNQFGDNYRVSFNPYDECHDATPIDVNDPTSFNVGMKVIMSFKTTVGTSEVYTGAEEVTLACSFASEYTATADLGVLTVATDTYLQVSTTTFEIDIEMGRYTDNSYGTPADAAVIAYSDVFFEVVGNNHFLNTRFNLRVFEVNLEKVNADGTTVDASLKLFDHANSDACTRMGGLNLLWSTDDAFKTQNFQYKAIFLDNDTTATYRISVKAKACAPGADSTQCTRSYDC